MEDDDWRDMQYCKAVYLPHDIRKEIESQRFFRPKSTKGKNYNTFCIEKLI